MGLFGQKSVEASRVVVEEPETRDVRTEIRDQLERLCAQPTATSFLENTTPRVDGWRRKGEKAPVNFVCRVGTELSEGKFLFTCNPGLDPIRSTHPLDFQEAILVECDSQGKVVAVSFKDNDGNMSSVNLSKRGGTFLVDQLYEKLQPFVRLMLTSHR